MIYFSGLLRQKYSEYANIDNKVSRDIKNGKYIKIVKGLYEDDKNTPGYLLAGSIYGPSYLSFDYALSYYNLIPERVVNYTSATNNKKKHKNYDTYFGVFTYQDVPTSVYFKEIKLMQEGEYYYQIATPEKAICDKIYSLSPIKTISNLKIMLFDDLRIDENEFNKLNKKVIIELAEDYHSSNVKLLAKYMKGEKDE